MIPGAQSDLYRTNEELQKKFADAREAIKASKSELEQVKSQLQSVQGQAEGKQTELQSAQTELQNAQAELQSRQADLQNTQAELEKVRSEFQATFVELQNRQTALEQAQGELQKKGGEIERNNSETQKLRDGFAELQKERDIVAQRLTTAEAARENANAAQVQLMELRSENAELQAACGDYKERALRAEEVCNGMRERQVNDEGNRAELRAQISILQGQIERLQNAPPPEPDADKIKPLEEQILRLQDLNSTLTSERDSLKINEGHMKEELTAAQSELRMVKALKENQHPATPEPDLKAQSRIQTLEAQIADANSKAENLTREVADLQQQVEISRTERDAAHSELQTVKALKESQPAATTPEPDLEAQSRLQTLETQIADANSKAENLTREVANLQQQLDTSRAERDAAHSELQTAKALKESQPATTIPEPDFEAQNRLQALETQIADANSKAENLTHEVADLQQQLEVSRTERDSAHRDCMSMQAARDDVRARLSQREEALVKASLTTEVMQRELDQLRKTASPSTEAPNEEAEKLRDAVSQAKREKEEHQTKAQELSEELRVSTLEIHAMKASLATVTAEYEASRNILKEKQKALDDAVVAMASARLESGRLETALATISAAHDRTRKEHTTVQKRTADLESDLRIRSQELEVLRGELKEAKAREAAQTQEAKKAAEETDKAAKVEEAAKPVAEKDSEVKAEAVETPKSSNGSTPHPVEKIEPAAGADTAAVKKIAALEEELRQLQEQYIRATEAELVYKGLVEETDRDLNEAHGRVKSLSVERDRLAAALSNAKNGAGGGDELEELKANHEQLQRDLKEMQAKLAEHADDIQNMEIDRDQLKAELEIAKSALIRTRVPAAGPLAN